jgi:transposase
MVTAQGANYRRVIPLEPLMPKLAAVPVALRACERAALKKRARGHKTPHRDRLRAQIILLAARDQPNTQIAASLGITQDTARKWRGRFAERGLAGLTDLPRPGRPRRITALERAEVCALACQLPAATGVPLARWTGPELVTELTGRGLVSGISVSSVRRILAENPIKPWQYQSWIFPRDPEFAAKAAVVLDLYQGFYRGEPLGTGDHIISVDAKPSIQARARRHPATPPAPGRPMRIEHEYKRMGALALLAGLDVLTGKVHAACPKTTGTAPFMELIDQVMSQQPYKNARRVFVVVDNGSDHRGKKAIKRLRDRYPNCIMIHTPVHASWLNQVEIFFSIVQKKIVSPNDFASLAELKQTLLSFVDRYNTTARPFNWKYTATDLTEMLARISVHEEPAHDSVSAQEAA